MKDSVSDNIVFSTHNPFPGDMSEYRKLFENVFGTPDYFDFFTRISNGDGYLVDAKSTDGVLAGMLFLYPCMLKNKDNSALGYYMYSVCTSPSFRGRGIFKSMCAYADSVAEEHGGEFIVLVPADEKLYETYTRMGYNIPIYGRVPAGDDYDMHLPEEAERLFNADLARSQTEPVFIMIRSAQPFTRKNTHDGKYKDNKFFKKGLLKLTKIFDSSNNLLESLPDADNFPE